jgi:SOS-response transcriptional repressor LexA
MTKKRDYEQLNQSEKALLEILSAAASKNNPTPKMCDLLEAIGKNDRSAIASTLKRLEEAGFIKVTNITAFKKQVLICSSGLSTRSTERGPKTRPKEAKREPLVPFDLKGRVFQDANIPEERGRAPIPNPTYVTPRESQ